MFQSAETGGMLSTLRFPFRLPLGARRFESGLAQASERRFASLVETHLDAIYRTARRLGTRDGDLEDLVQEVLVVLARRLDDIEVDKERAFALGTTARVAAGLRRKARRRREELVAEVDAEDDPACSVSPPQALHGERRVEHAEALELLRAGLDAMTEAQRVTFVLFELEELRASEIPGATPPSSGCVRPIARSARRMRCAAARSSAPVTSIRAASDGSRVLAGWRAARGWRSRLQ